MTKLIVFFFCNFANAPKSRTQLLYLKRRDTVDAKRLYDSTCDTPGIVRTRLVIITLTARMSNLLHAVLIIVIFIMREKVV
jgi:hypothetical protein